MALRSKIVLKNGLSSETLESIRSYLRQFLDRRYSLEHFNGTVSIYLYEPEDVRLVREHFASLVANVQDLR